MQEWEYCRMEFKQGGLGRDRWEVVYFKTTGEQVATHRCGSGGGRDTLARVCAQLGQEGWEMVSVTDEGRHYFKRPAQGP